MSDNKDKLAEQIWYCFPADSYDSVAEKLGARLGRKVEKSEVNDLVSYVRRNSERLGWTIPHCKRGQASPGRLMRVLTDGKGTMVFDRDGDRDKLERGAYGTVSHAATMSKHLTESLTAAAQLTTKRVYREYLEGLAEDCQALSKKAARVAKIIKIA